VRAVERERTRISPTEVLAAERRLVASRFGGSTRAYRSALADVHATPAVARAIIGDELRRNEIQSGLAAARPSSADVARYRATYGPVLARRVVVSPAPSWLPEGEGIAIATSAPEAVFRARTGRTFTVRTLEGRFTVRALEQTAALGALGWDLARPAIVRELRDESRADAYASWSLGRQKAAESRLVCERDRLPERADVRLSTFAPFLSFEEPSADTLSALSGG